MTAYLDDITARFLSRGSRHMMWAVFLVGLVFGNERPALRLVDSVLFAVMVGCFRAVVGEILDPMLWATVHQGQGEVPQNYVSMWQESHPKVKTRIRYQSDPGTVERTWLFQAHRAHLFAASQRPPL